MRHPTRILTAAALSAGLAVPAAAESVYNGTLLFDNVSNCVFAQKNWRFKSTYMVAALNGNPNVSSISTVWGEGAIGYSVSGYRFYRTFRNVLATGFSNRTLSFAARLRVSSSTPALADLTATTDFLSITGQIERPFDDPGVNGLPCVATFRASYYLLP